MKIGCNGLGYPALQTPQIRPFPCRIDGKDQYVSGPSMAQVAQPLLRHLDTHTGSLKFSQLRQLANNPGVDPQTRRAAQALFQDANLRHAVDSARDNEIDGTFEVDDLRRVVTEEQVANSSMSVQEVAATMRDNFRILDAADGDPDDGEIDRENLLKVMENPDTSLRLREACRNLLSNSNYQRSLSLGLGYGEADVEEWKLDSIQAVASRGERVLVSSSDSDYQRTIQAGKVVEKNFDRIDKKAQVPGFGAGLFHLDASDGKVTRAELETALADPNCSPELKQAGQLLLRNSAFLNTLGEDGILTRESIGEAAAANQKAALEDVQRLRAQRQSYTGKKPQQSMEWNRLDHALQHLEAERPLPDRSLYRSTRLASDIVGVAGTVADLPELMKDSKVKKLVDAADRIPSPLTRGLGVAGKVLGPVGAVFDGIDLVDAIDQGDGVRIGTSSAALAGTALCAVPGGAIVGVPLMVGSFIVDFFTESDQERAESSEEAAHELFAEQGA